MANKEKYSKENFQKAILESNSIKEALKKMDLRAAGGNYKIFHKYVKLYGLNTSHFDERIKVYKRTLGVYKMLNKIPLEKVMIENSTYSRTSLKERLYKEGLKQRKCELCGQGEEWKGKHMSLILDHKNGIYNDNRLENLRIVCPNCNATLDTHCGKQRKKVDGRNRPGVERRKANRPPLEQLKKEIQELGYSATGRKYGVSDNAIRKWVKSYEKYNI